MLTSLVALALSGLLPQATTSGPPILVDGKPMPAVFPKLGDSLPDAEVRGWSGWGELKGEFAKSYVTAGDWASLANIPLVATPVVWRERVFVFSQVDSVITDPDGTVHLRRGSFEDAPLADLLASLVRFRAGVAKATGGRVLFSPEISIEREAMEVGSATDFPTKYVGPRVNGGEYEADDHIYRGPYHGILVLTPTLSAKPGSVNGMPLATVSYYPNSGGLGSGTFERQLFAAWESQVSAQMSRHGLSGWPLEDEWAGLSSLGEVPTDTLLANYAKPRTKVERDQPFAAVAQPAFATANYHLSVVPDTERGHALLVSEGPGHRQGGADLAIDLSKLDTAKTPTLTFLAKSEAKDPFALEFVGESAVVRVVLGRDLEANPDGAGKQVEVAFSATGTWQTVSVPLDTVSAALGGQKISHVRIVPTNGSRIASRVKPQPIELRVDGFALSTTPSAVLEPRVANLASTDATERLMAVGKLAQAGLASPELVTALQDPDRSVRATAVNAYTKIKDPLAEPALISLTMSIDPQVAELTIPALANQGTPTAQDALRRAMKSGLTERTKAAAARKLAESKDPKLAGDIMVLLASRSWQTRLASAEALGQLPGPEAGIIRLTYLQQNDPEIKLAATLSADPTREYDMRKMQWSAVNETSDVVRLTSQVKLIQSSDPVLRGEGYKGVRDDSIWVRAELLRWLGDHPSEAHRPTILLGLADSHASVRAAAVTALAQQLTDVLAAEVSGVLSDRHPSVQMALLRLSKLKKFPLPEATMAAIKASPVPAVQDLLSGMEREETKTR